MPSGSDSRKTLLIVFFTVFLDLVGFGIIIPIQPFLAEKLGASPTVVTLLGASFSLMQFLFGSFWGRLSDRIGRRPVMLVSIATACAGYTLFGFAETLPMLFAARMLAGFGSANIGTAQAIIADSTPPENRAKGMGLIGAAFGLGFIFGPAIGGFFAQLGLSVPAFVAGGLCALNWVFAFFKLPETLVFSDKANTRSQHPGFSWAELKHAARHTNVGKIFLLYFVFFTAFSLMEQDLGLFIEHTWLSHVVGQGGEMHGKQAASMTAYVLIVVGITAAIVQGGLIGRLVGKFGEIKLLRAGTIIVAFTFLCIPFIGMSGIFSLMLVISMCMAIGTGITNPSLSSLLSQLVDPDERGGVLGIGQSLASLGRVVGPSVGGLLFEIHPGVPFWVAAVLTLACTLVAFKIHRAKVS